MATFSVNQNRQLFVMKSDSFKNNKSLVKVEGDITITAPTDKNYFYFTYQGANTLMRSDLIDVDKVVSATLTSASNLRRYKKAVWVELDKEVNEGNPISGQDYILRIAFRQYTGNSDQDIYLKYGAVHATANMTAAQFYAKMAISLAKNFSREYTKLVSIHLITGDGHNAQSAEVTATTELDTLTLNYTGIMIQEEEQPWVLGTKKQVPVYFDVIPTTITYNGDEVKWGVSEEYDKSDETIIGNGKTIADLEWFCMGERGDQYRGIGYPNYIPTKYLVDPSQEYDVLDIHYYFSDSGVGVQRSEKLLTIVAPTGSLETLKTALANIVTVK